MKYFQKKLSILLTCFTLLLLANINKVNAQVCTGTWSSNNHLDYDCISGEWIGGLNSGEPVGCPVNPVYFSGDATTFTFGSPVSGFELDFNAFSTVVDCGRMQIKINGVFYPLTAANLSPMATSGGLPCNGFNVMVVTSDGYLTSGFGSLETTNGQGKLTISGVNATTVTISTNDPAGTVIRAPYNCIAVVPIKLKSFTGRSAADCKAILSWQSETESDIKTIEVQRSIDGIAFKKIIDILPKGSNSQYTIETDNYTDAYFRLKINDLDGNYKYSHVIPVRANCSRNGYQVNPNPAHNSVEVSGLKKDDMVFVLDMLGRKALIFNSAGSTNSFNIQKLAPGMYYLQVLNAGMIKANLKLIKN